MMMRDQREGHRQRQREQDRDRVQPRLELRREHQVHEDEREHEGEAGSSAAARPSSLRAARSGRRRSPAASSFGARVLLSAAIVALCESSPAFTLRDDRDLAPAVVAIDLRRARARGEGDHVVEGHGAELVRGHAEALEARDRRSGRSVTRADVDVVLLAVLVVGRDLRRRRRGGAASRRCRRR